MAKVLIYIYPFDTMNVKEEARLMHMADYIFEFETEQTTEDVADDFSLIAIKRQLKGFTKLLKSRDGRAFELPARVPPTPT